MNIPVSSVPEILADANSANMLRFVASADAKNLILRLKQQSQITDDEVLALAVIAGEAALAKFVDPEQNETCAQAINDIFSVLDHEAVVLALRRKVRELLADPQVHSALSPLD